MGNLKELQIGDLIWYDDYDFGRIHGLGMVLDIAPQIVYNEVKLVSVTCVFFTGKYAWQPQFENLEFVKNLRKEFLQKFGDIYGK